MTATTRNRSTLDLGPPPRPLFCERRREGKGGQAPACDQVSAGVAPADTIAYRTITARLPHLELHQLGWRPIGRNPHGRACRGGVYLQIAHLVIRRRHIFRRVPG